MSDDRKKAVRVNITMPAETLEELDNEILALGMTRSTYICMAVRSRLNSDKMLRDMPGLVSKVSEMVKVVNYLETKDFPSSKG